MSSTSKLDDLISGPATQLLDALMLHLPVGLTIARVPNVEIVRVSDAGARLLQRPKDLLEGVEVSMHPNAYRVWTREREQQPIRIDCLLPAPRYLEKW